MEFDWSPSQADWPDGPLQQDWAWGAELAGAGARLRRVRLGDAGAAQILVRGRGPLRLALISRGPVWTAGARPDLLRLLARRLGGVLLVTGDVAARTGDRLGDRTGDRAAGLPLMTPAFIAELPLGGDLRARMAGKWRNRLVAAERAGVVMRRSRAADWMIPAERAQAAERGYRGYPPEVSARHPGRQVFEAWSDGRRVAAMLFLRHGDRATYQIGLSDPVGRRLSAHALCLWEAMTWARAQGLSSLDLGTVDTVRAPGLARFKIGAGAVVRPLGPTVWIPPV